MWPLCAMENALFSDVTLDWERRCATIAAAGFAGVYAVPYPLREEDFSRLARLDEAPARHGLRVAGVYANLDLAEPPAGEAAQRVERLLQTVSGTPRVELSFKCSIPAALPPSPEDAILARLEPLLAIAEKRDLDLALYPHSFYPLETTTQAERIVRRVAHPRLEFVFATSHVFALRSAEDVTAELQACARRIVGFNVCGCRRLAARPPSKCASLPLDEGDLPLAPIFAALATAGYRSDVIVQGHGWSGNGAAMLRRCVETFNQLSARITHWSSNLK